MAIYNGYVGAKTCTQGPTTGARGVMSWFLAKYADDGGLNAGIYNCRPIRGSTRTTSLHGEGRAVDLAIRPYSAKYGTELADLIRRHSAELGIQCVIWNRRIWSGYYDEFRPYTGVNPHVDHLHVELTWAAANRSATATVALWEEVLGHLVDNEGDVRPVASKPASKPKPKPASSGNSKADNKAVQQALAWMLIDAGQPDGVDGPKMKAGVKIFQRAHGLVDDGYWGPKTQAVYERNVRLQNAIKKMKGVPDTWRSDGYIGKTSKRWIAYTNDRQGWGTGSAVTNKLINHLKAAKAW